jgi:hypothetical protein
VLEAKVAAQTAAIDSLKKQLEEKDRLTKDLTSLLDAERQAAARARAEVQTLQDSLKDAKVQVRGWLTWKYIEHDLGSTGAVHIKGRHYKCATCGR